mgnify:FL=1
MAKPGKKKKKVLFVLEIIVLLLFIGGLYVYGQIMSKLDKIEQPVFEDEKVAVNPEAPEMTGYTTYALFGIDHRDKNTSLAGENSDTMIIASVNNDTKDVKLVSVYRDTLMNIGNDTYAKANAAYAYGGPEQAISMLNTNLDLNITEYATVDFNALTTVIDALGGLDIPMSYAEIEHMNNYCVETAEETGKTYTPIEKPEPAPEDQEAIIGTYHLNGVQATSYCRIRYTASLDMGRTERQRRVIQMIVNKAKGAGLTTIFDIMDEVFPMVQTSLTQTEILKLIPAMIGYSLDDTTGFPQNYKFSNIKGSIIVPTNLDTNVAELHKFLYGEANYTPTSLVTEVSNKILEIVGGSEQLVDEAPVPSADDDQADQDFTWQDNGDGGSWNDNSGGGNYDPGTGGDGNYDPGTGGDGNYDPGTGGGDTGGGDVGGGDTGGGDIGGGDVGGGDTGGGDIGGGDTGGGDVGGGDVGGGDVGGGDVGGGDTGGGDVGGGDVGGGDVGGGEVVPDGGSGDYTEPVVEQ